MVIANKLKVKLLEQNHVENNRLILAKFRLMTV